MAMPTMGEIEELVKAKRSPDHKKKKRGPKEPGEKDLLCHRVFQGLEHTHSPDNQGGKEKVGLEWIRMSMAYTRFSNLL